MRFAMVLLLGVSSVIWAPSRAHAAKERPKLAVLDLQGKGVDRGTVETLSEVVTVSLKKLGVFDIISRSDIQQMLNFEESKQLVGCTASSECMAEVGGALGVARLVSGSVGKVGSSFVITLTLVDTKTARVIERESRTADTEEKLLAEVDGAARFLVRSLLEGRLGDVIVKASENAAEVEIDGKLVGQTPMPLMKMAGGPHTVRISKKGFVTYARDIAVDEKQATVLDANLIPSTEFIDNYDSKANAIRAAAYVSTGVGAAMVATSLVLWFAVAEPQNARNSATYDALIANGNVPSDAQKTQLNSQATSIRTLYTVSQIVGVAGGVVAAAGLVMFFAGPKPGVYDQYKRVDVSGTKVSFEVSPLASGLYVGAHAIF